MILKEGTINNSEIIMSDNENGPSLSGHVHTDAFLFECVFDRCKTHRLICVHTSVFMAFSSVSLWTVENTNTVCSVFKSSMIPQPYMSPVGPAYHHMGYHPPQQKQQQLNSSTSMSSSLHILSLSRASAHMLDPK